MSLKNIEHGYTLPKSLYRCTMRSDSSATVMPDTTTTIRKPQTLAQAKAAYRKHGPRISSQEHRRLERGHELMLRAKRIKEREERKKANARRRSEKELRTRETRRNQGLPSQEPPKVRASQHRLDFGLVKEPQEQALQSVMAREQNSSGGSSPREDESETDQAEHFSDTVEAPDDLSMLEDFLPSSTQISRDIASPPRPASTSKPQIDLDSCSYPPTYARKGVDLDIDLESISTQDISLDDDDLHDLGIQESEIGLGAKIAAPITMQRHSNSNPTPALPRAALAITKTTVSSRVPLSHQSVSRRATTRSPPAVKHKEQLPLLLSDGFEDAFELSTQDRREICS